MAKLICLICGWKGDTDAEHAEAMKKCKGDIRIALPNYPKRKIPR